MSSGQRRRYVDNPEPSRAKTRRRKAQKLGNDYEPYDFAAIVEASHHTCYLCGEQPEKLTPDHVIPLIRGGPDADWNIRPACLPCNSSKGPRLLAELSYSPAISPDDLRLWVVLAPGERWAPDPV